MNIHIVVLITSIIFYFYLRNKTGVIDKPRQSSILYILYVPLIIYTGYYYFGQGSEIPVLPRVNSHTSDDLLSEPFPTSSSSNSFRKNF